MPTSPPASAASASSASPPSASQPPRAKRTMPAAAASAKRASTTLGQRRSLSAADSSASAASTALALAPWRQLVSTGRIIFTRKSVPLRLSRCMPALTDMYNHFCQLHQLPPLQVPPTDGAAVHQTGLDQCLRYSFYAACNPVHLAAMRPLLAAHSDFDLATNLDAVPLYDPRMPQQPFALIMLRLDSPKWTAGRRGAVLQPPAEAAAATSATPPATPIFKAQSAALTSTSTSTASSSSRSRRKIAAGSGRGPGQSASGKKKSLSASGKSSSAKSTSKRRAFREVGNTLPMPSLSPTPPTDQPLLFRNGSQATTAEELLKTPLRAITGTSSTLVTAGNSPPVWSPPSLPTPPMRGAARLAAAKIRRQTQQLWAEADSRLKQHGDGDISHHISCSLKAAGEQASPDSDDEENAGCWLPKKRMARLAVSGARVAAAPANLSQEQPQATAAVLPQEQPQATEAVLRQGGAFATSAKRRHSAASTNHSQTSPGATLVSGSTAAGCYSAPSAACLRPGRIEQTPVMAATPPSSTSDHRPLLDLRLSEAVWDEDDLTLSFVLGPESRCTRPRSFYELITPRLATWTDLAERTLDLQVAICASVEGQPAWVGRPRQGPLVHLHRSHESDVARYLVGQSWLPQQLSAMAKIDPHMAGTVDTMQLLSSLFFCAPYTLRCNMGSGSARSSESSRSPSSAATAGAATPRAIAADDSEKVQVSAHPLCLEAASAEAWSTGETLAHGHARYLLAALATRYGPLPLSPSIPAAAARGMGGELAAAPRAASVADVSTAATSTVARGVASRVDDVPLPTDQPPVASGLSSQGEPPELAPALSPMASPLKLDPVTGEPMWWARHGSRQSLGFSTPPSQRLRLSRFPSLLADMDTMLDQLEQGHGSMFDAVSRDVDHLLDMQSPLVG